MNGAESVLKALEAAGVEVCFANPGTSEMNLVAAIDRSPTMRPVLALFEGVASGCADGYARMSGRPAVCLLHLGPGFANAMANIHNARKAGSPMLNLVGDHATYHRKYDAPLNSDIEAIVASVSHWSRISKDGQALVQDISEAIAAANTAPGRIASLIVPADLAWNEAPEPLPAALPPAPAAADSDAMESALAALDSGEPCAVMLGGSALRDESLILAGRIAAHTGATLITDFFPARMQRGVGRPLVQRIPYFAEMAVEYLSAFKHLILVGAKPPVAFFAYPDKPGWLCPESCRVHPVADTDCDLLSTLRQMAEHLGAQDAPKRAVPGLPPLTDGELTAEGVAVVVAHRLPPGAIVSDEAATAGMSLFPMTAAAPPHDWMCVTGGSIGQALPVAAGAAIACPDRQVLCMSGDGGAMYTVQALWTMAREDLDVVTVIYANRSYAILNVEFQRTGAGVPGDKARSMLTLDQPVLDWVSIAGGMGVPASRVATVTDFDKALQAALARKGPTLIEAVVPPFKPG